VCVCARARARDQCDRDAPSRGGMPRNRVEAPQEKKKLYKYTSLLVSSVLNVWVMHNLENLPRLNIL
jgi:hypothetical protein